MSHPLLSIVIPTRNERANVRPLTEELAHALSEVPYTYEVLFVDASTDGTRHMLARLAREYPHVRCVVPHGRDKSLALSCLEGFQRARGTYICVMDADLQHPADVVPRFMEALVLGADIAVGTRYATDEGAVGLASTYRRLVSRSMTRLVHRLVPRTRTTSDPLSGFFAFRKRLLRRTALHPLGFKILLELLARAPHCTVLDIPYSFRPRVHGTSKAHLAVGVAFLAHLWRLRRTMSATA